MLDGMTVICVDMLEYLKGPITRKEWKESHKKSLLYNDKYFNQILIFMLTRGVIDCKDGFFWFNNKYSKQYVNRFGRSPNFCTEHFHFFEEYVNPKQMEND